MERYTIIPQYWRVIVDLRTDDTVYFSIDDVNEMNKVSTFEIVGFVIIFVLSLPLLLAWGDKGTVLLSPFLDNTKMIVYYPIG